MLGGIRNPFLQQVIADPWDPMDADITSINQKPFELSRQLIDEVAMTGKSSCLLIHGEAGSGKTHLMSRLRASLESELGPLLIAVRLETVPSRIWRHIRRSLATDLLRPGPSGPARLERLIGKMQSEQPKRDSLSYGLSTVLEHYAASHMRELIKKLEIEFMDANTEVVAIQCIVHTFQQLA